MRKAILVKKPQFDFTLKISSKFSKSRAFLKYSSNTILHHTAAINELLCLKNAGAQISLYFTSYE